MSSIQCRYPGCSGPATAKCGICRKVYCVQHIQRTGPIDTCDVCIAIARGLAIAEKEAVAARFQAEQAEAAARRKAEITETLARLEAERPRREADRKRREANRQKRVTLAWIGGTMTVAGFVIASGYNAHNPPIEAPLPVRVMLGVLIFGGIIVLLTIFAFRD